MLQVKKGDRVIITGGYRHQHEERTVDSVGPKWITVGRNRYNRVNGYGEYGAHLYTLEAYEKWQRYAEVSSKLSKLGIDLDSRSPLRGHEEAMIEAVLAIAPEMRAKVEDE